MRCSKENNLRCHCEKKNGPRSLKLRGRNFRISQLTRMSPNRAPITMDSNFLLSSLTTSKSYCLTLTLKTELL